MNSELTVREHILFYARLKGIPSSQETHHCDLTLREVGLFDAQHRLSKDLSGGMKRRLSIAISLVGNTDVVFMDEPTVSE
jgi:ABC-type multidrug transport system ATPase subunit